MSLIIKGMEMPKNGEMTIAFASDENGENTLALLLDTNGKPIEHKGVAEIHTPHGRLIDAEELKEDFVGLSKISPELKLISEGVVNVIDEAPTVIEAEE